VWGGGGGAVDVSDQWQRLFAGLLTLKESQEELMEPGQGKYYGLASHRLYDDLTIHLSLGNSMKHPSIYSSIHPFIYSSIHSSIHPFIHLFIHSDEI